MSKEKARNQLRNLQTEEMYKKQCISLAMNVFNIKYLNEVAPYMDYSYVNKKLIYNGAIAFFWDEYLELLALPFRNIGKLDLYNRPINIQVFGRNGYNRILKYGEYVIMWDNMSHEPLIGDIIQYSTRIADLTRTIDINTSQQRTPRFWKTKTENLKTIQDVVEGVSANNEVITTFDNLELDETSLVLAPAPYVSDKLSELKDKIWNEFLRLIGIANSSFQKRERNIKDEVFISQAGTIASRFTRFNARVEAINKINEKWGDKMKNKLEVEYYDGLPTTLKDEESDNNEEYMDTYTNVSNESNNG